jgi:hypothetical protein
MDQYGWQLEFSNNVAYIEFEKKNVCETVYGNTRNNSIVVLYKSSLIVEQKNIKLSLCLTTSN